MRGTRARGRSLKVRMNRPKIGRISTSSRGLREASEVFAHTHAYRGINVGGGGGLWRVLDDIVFEGGRWASNVLGDDRSRSRDRGGAAGVGGGAGGR